MPEEKVWAQFRRWFALGRGIGEGGGGEGALGDTAVAPLHLLMIKELETLHGRYKPLQAHRGVTA